MAGVIHQRLYAQGGEAIKIVRSVLLTAFNGLLLFVLLFTLGRTDDLYFDAGDEFPFSRGNASAEVRSSIMQQLHDFQDGYTRRDPSQAESFAARLFSPDSIVILGTMPEEIFVGPEEATRLVESDWRYWGDCRFLMDNAQISAAGPVAWFSTIGTVRMDGVNLVLPLRLSGVLVEEDGVWRFQQLQFQFDLNLSWLILGNALLLGWLVVNVLLVVYQVFRAVRRLASARDRRAN